MSTTIKVLSLLEAYEERQQEAQKVWKKSQWNLTKAKQSKGSPDAFAATNVREEIRPRCVLVEDIPNLEDEDNKESSSSSILPHFRLVDPMEQQEQLDKENATSAKPTTKADQNASGLRNRRGKETESTKEWTVTEDSTLVDDETKLRSVDPIDLFGLPTRELRQAKQEAHLALAVYVEAANLLLALQREMKD